MRVERHYSRTGAQAYVILWRVAEDGTHTLLRLVYAKAPDFAALWAAGIDWTPVDVDAEV